LNLEPLIQFTLFLKHEKPNIYISRWGDEKIQEMYVVSDATISCRETIMKSCKTFELGFLKLVEVKKP
jgi:hypothetical protein